MNDTTHNPESLLDVAAMPGDHPLKQLSTTTVSALYDLDTVSEKAERITTDFAAKVKADRDLTQAAKARKIAELASQHAEAIQAVLTAVDNVPKAALAHMNRLQAVDPLPKGDADARAADEERRAALRTMPDKDRSRLLAEARAGKNPSVAAAVLRGDSWLSGASPEDFAAIHARALVHRHRDTLMLLSEAKTHAVRARIDAQKTLDRMASLAGASKGALTVANRELPAERMLTDKLMALRPYLEASANG
tara:strand:+ start:11612 stop:12361 length:750 start_codon:yes stop_codon:yes gene_type:complete